MRWNLEGQRVAGVYLGAYTVEGIVIWSRVKYGGMVQHTVQLDQPLELFGNQRDSVLLDHNELIPGA
jgi:hypothetical protein